MPSTLTTHKCSISSSTWGHPELSKGNKQIIASGRGKQTQRAVQASLHLLGDLENSQQPQGTQNADPKGCARSEEPPEHLKNAAYYHLEGNQE